MAIIAVAAIPTVASFIARMGITQAAKRYAPKLIKEAQKYIKKHNLTKKAPTLGKKTAESMKKTTKKMQVVNKKINPKTKTSNKKTTTTTNKKSFDEKLKEVEGTRAFNLRNKQSTKTTTKTDSGGVKEVQKKYNFDPKKIAAGKNDKLVNKKTTTKKIDDTKLTSNVNKTPTMISTILGKAQKHPFATGMVVIPASMGLVNKASDMMKNMGVGGKTEAKTFGQAFREARKEKGPDAVFTYKGKQYSTVTEDQYKKAGFNSLREYLNAKKNK